MREMLQHRGMRLLVAANLISMIGSGMNAAAVIWYILQATHSEVSLGLLIALQTLPSLVLLPFTGVLIDREDRRHLMMWLDVCRGAGHPRWSPCWRSRIACICGSCTAMTILVSIGFWMFWPTHQRAGAGADARRQAARFQLAHAGGGAGRLGAGRSDGRVCVQQDRAGRRAADRLRHLRRLDRVRVPGAQGTRDGLASRSRHRRQPRPPLRWRATSTNWEKASVTSRSHRRVLLLGVAWALFIAAMMTQGVISAPLSDRILHGGAVGYGWINAGWASGAFTSMFYASRFIRRNGAHRSVTVTMCVIAVCTRSAARDSAGLPLPCPSTS